MSKKDGGAAFPRSDGGYSLTQDGMSLRDWFAGQALPAIYHPGGRYGEDGLKQVAEYAFAMADAMLAHRNTSP